MARIAKFYERLPKGAAPDRSTGGLLGRYQARYFGKDPSAARKFDRIHSLEGSDRYSNLARNLWLDGAWIRFRILLPLETSQEQCPLEEDYLRLASP